MPTRWLRGRGGESNVYCVGTVNMGTGASTHVKAIEEDTNVTNELPAGRPVSVKNKTETSKNSKSKNSLNCEETTTVTTTNVKSSPPTVTKVKKMKPTLSSSSLVQSSPMASTSKVQQLSSAQAELEMKVEQLEKELAEKESDRLDHMDQIQALEERVLELTSAMTAPDRSGDGDLGETLKAKDLYIRQMEQQLEAEQAESKKVRIRLKKKIRNLTAQLSEAKQESSIAQLEFKERNDHLQNELRSSKADGHALQATSQDKNDDNTESKMKIILDLSAEVSDQAEKISSLEQLLTERDSEIEQLKNAVKQATKTAQLERVEHSASPLHPRDSLTQVSQHQQNNRQMMLSNSGRRAASGFTPVESITGDNGSAFNSQQRGQRPRSKIGPRPGNPPAASSEFTLQRQSTALSDSDSDWEMEDDPTKIRSAPARVRVKSAATIPEEEGSDVDNKWNLVTDDNDLLLSSQARPRGPNRNQKKSALKTKLERVRNERAKGLLGPSLAFAQPAGDQLTDTSCNNTPAATPRVTGNGYYYGSKDVMTLAV